MTATLDRTLAGPCLGCGELLEPDATFCPECGTRQAPDRPMPVRATPADTDRLARSTNMWIVSALVAVALLLVAVGMLAGTMSATVAGDERAPGDGGEGAAATMDAYAPFAETWAEKHRNVADEAAAVGPVDTDGLSELNGLAIAADDAGVWIDTNRADLGGVAAAADGASAPRYEELAGIFDERAAVLGEIEAIATAGGVGDDAVTSELAALEELDLRADAATCEIADVMRAEGDDPVDHITADMDVTC
jgi:hypothetical protein